MTLYNLYTTVLESKRVMQLLWILAKHSIGGFFDITSYRMRRSLFVKKQSHNSAERVKKLIEELGPTFVKFGQILADRPDIVSDKFRTELKRLQNHVVEFNTNSAIVLIEKEIGCSINTVFKEFDTQPLAAASIGQVYSAVLKNGAKVVVKIQRPNIESKIKLDISLLKYLAKRLNKNYPELAAMNIAGLVDEFAESIMEELDFTKEAGNTEYFYKMFSDDVTVKIPKVYKQFTTRKVIVMERIEGYVPESADYIREKGMDPDIVVNNGAKAIFQMIIKHGAFHADPHPGNVFILENNVVAFIDFGIISVLRPDEIDFLADYTIGFARKDNILITKSLLKLCAPPFFDREDEVLYDIKRALMRNSAEGALDIKNFSATLQTSIDIIIKYDLRIPSGIFLLLKTLMTLEKFSQRLCANIDLSSVILPYSNEVVKNRYTSRRMAYDIYETALSYVKLVRDTPKDLSEILYKLKEGKIRHEIHLDDDALFTRTVRQMSLRIAYVLLLIGVFIGSSILVVLDYQSKYGTTVLTITSIMIVLLLIRWSFIKNK